MLVDFFNRAAAPAADEGLIDDDGVAAQRTMVRARQAGRVANMICYNPTTPLPGRESIYPYVSSARSWLLL